MDILKWIGLCCCVSKHPFQFNTVVFFKLDMKKPLLNPGLADQILNRTQLE